MTAKSSSNRRRTSQQQARRTAPLSPAPASSSTAASPPRTPPPPAAASSSSSPSLSSPRVTPATYTRRRRRRKEDPSTYQSSSAQIQHQQQQPPRSITSTPSFHMVPTASLSQQQQQQQQHHHHDCPPRDCLCPLQDDDEQQIHIAAAPSTISSCSSLFLPATPNRIMNASSPSASPLLQSVPSSTVDFSPQPFTTCSTTTTTLNLLPAAPLTAQDVEQLRRGPTQGKPKSTTNQQSSLRSSPTSAVAPLSEEDKQLLTDFEVAWDRFVVQNAEHVPQQQRILELQREIDHVQHQTTRVQGELEHQLSHFSQARQDLEQTYQTKLSNAVQKQLETKDHLLEQLAIVKNSQQLQQETIPWRHFLHQVDGMVQEKKQREQEQQREKGAKKQQQQASEPAKSKTNHDEQDIVSEKNNSIVTKPSKDEQDGQTPTIGDATVSHPASPLPKKSVFRPSDRALALTAKSSAGEADGDSDNDEFLLRAYRIDHALLSNQVNMLEKEVARHEACLPSQEMAAKFLTEHNVWGILTESKTAGGAAASSCVFTTSTASTATRGNTSMAATTAAAAAGDMVSTSYSSASLGAVTNSSLVDDDDSSSSDDSEDDDESESDDDDKSHATANREKALARVLASLS